jgi:hypothetical protein
MRCFKQHDEAGINTIFIAHGGVSRAVVTIQEEKHPDTFYDAEPIAPGAMIRLDVPDLTQKYQGQIHRYAKQPLLNAPEWQ